jgi:radical SAM protein with 4Fe4S-binding SPASM domain
MLIEHFSKYVAHPALDLAFHVITRPAPDNTYFNAVNLLTNHTHKNSMCFRVQGDPLWFNVDGTVSACCRDYHGELYVGDIRNQTFDEILKGEGLRKMQEAHESGDLSAYPPCNDCFRPDKRLDEIFNSTVHYFMHITPGASGAYYQKRVDDLCNILQSNGNYREKVEALLAKTS